MKKYFEGSFEEIANQMVLYRLKTSWLTIARVFNEVAASEGLSLSMAFVLVALNEEAGTEVTKIAPRIGLEPNSLSRILKELEKNKLITKKKDKNDKRKVYISLTPTGKLKRQLALKVVFKMEHKLIEQIGQKDLAGFIRVTDQVSDAVERFKEEL